MEVKEEKPISEKTIPVFTVLKNGAILKNIFIVNSRDFSSPERNGAILSGDDEVEEILVVGRHPDCDILLTHPSISRFHLQLRSIPSRQKLFVTDLSSVHGTWVTDQKVEPHACVEVKEGDVIRIGGSTRIYRLHWIPLSRAYDIDSPFVSPLDSSTTMEHEEENRMLEVESIEVDHESQGNNASVDEGDLHLDVTSEGTGSSVPSEDEDTRITTREISLPLASLSVMTVARDSEIEFSGDLRTSTEGDIDVVEVVAERPSISCVPSKQQSGDYQEGLSCAETEVSVEADEFYDRGDGGLHLNVMSERTYLAAQEISPLPLPRDTIETKALQLTEDVQASPELAISIFELKEKNPSSSLSPSNGQIDCSFEASGCYAFELDAEVEILSLGRDVSGEIEFGTKKLMEVPAESLTNAKIQSHENNEETEISRQLIETSSSSISQVEPTLEIFPEEARGLIVELAIDTGTGNLHQNSNEVNPTGDQNKKPGMNRESEKIFDEGSSLCISQDVEQVGSQSFVALANLEPETHKLIGSEGDSCNLSEIGDKGNTDKEVPFPSTFAAETSEDTKLTEELPYCTESQEHQTQQVPDVKDDALSEIDSSKRGKLSSVLLLEAACCSAFELTAEVEVLNLRQEVSGETGFVTKKVMEASAEPLSKTKIEDNGETMVARQVFAVPQTEPTLTGDARGLLGSEVTIETDRNGEIKVSSKTSTAADCWFSGNERLSRLNTEDIQSLCSSRQPLPESVVGAPSEIWSEVNPAEDQNLKSGISTESEEIFYERSSSCLSEEDLQESGIQDSLLTPTQKPETEYSIGLVRSKESSSQRELEGEECTEKESPIPSTLAAETLEDTKVTEELPSDPTGSQENQTPQTRAVGDDVLSEMDSSPMRLNTCNIWSRRGKAASILQLRTNKSDGKQKQIGNQPKAQLHRKQALSDKSISHVAENLETEIFTPDKENLTPRSHMLKRLQEIGDIRDSKSSSKLSVKSSSSKIPSRIDIVTSEAFTEPEIFTPDKENLTPTSHMLKRLRDVGEIKETNGSSSKATRKPFFDIHAEENLMVEQKPELQNMRSKSKVKKHEPVALKKKAERAPFQPLLENSSSRSQSYTEASFTASARNNFSRGIRSSSNLSDTKNKMKWTIVLDTSSLLDKESRKQLDFLQGLKGTHLVVPRTVLRELNETKYSRSLVFRRRTDIASSALDWIEECKVNTKWWIKIQSPSEETKATAPTPPVTPQSTFSLSLNWNNNNAQEIDSPTSEDQVLECALLYRKRNMDEKLVLLSNDVTLKIKAMREGVICETAHEFCESLVNPLSERFMWRESLPRGRTWSHLDDINTTCFPYRKKSTYNGGGGGRRGEIGAAAKGLKLILLHNSQYGHIQ